MPKNNKSEGFVPTLEAAVATARLLEDAGLSIMPTEDDIKTAASAVRGIAADTVTLKYALKPNELGRQTPASLIMVREILQEFGQKIVEEAESIRHLVMNKLVIETENPDPRVRLRSLELLGKMGDVSLFTERKEITVTHQTSDEVRDRLRARLARLLPQTPTEPEPEDAEVIDTPVPVAVQIEQEVLEAVAEEDEDDEEELYELSLEPKRASRSLFDE